MYSHGLQKYIPLKWQTKAIYSCMATGQSMWPMVLAVAKVVRWSGLWRQRRWFGNYGTI